MIVADFQKYLRALADAVNAVKPTNELHEAAEALSPFGTHSMADFAKFLQIAEREYSATGKLPLPVTVKPPPPPKPPGVAKPTIEQLLETVAKLKVRLKTDPSLNKDGVVAALEIYKTLPATKLKDVVKQLGIKSTQKNAAIAFETIVEHTIEIQGGIGRGGV